MARLPEYHGIRRGYPRLRRRLGRLAAYIQLCRPFTLLAPLLAGIFGALTPVKEPTLDHLLVAVYAGVTLALAQAAGQCLNQYADAELDRIVKPYRPIPSGAVTREEALGLAWILAGFAAARAFTLSTFFGLATLLLLFFAVFYSLPPFSPRRIHPILNTAWMAVSRGLLPVLAVWSVYGGLERAWPYSALAFRWVMGFQASKDVPDTQGDRIYGIRTIPNAYGLRGLVAVMAACTALYAASAVWLNMAVMLLILPLAVVAILTTKRQTSLTENTVAWCCMYIGLAAIYILAFINERG